MSRSHNKVKVRAEEIPPSALMETIYMLATLFCAALIGAFIGWGI